MGNLISTITVKDCFGNDKSISVFDDYCLCPECAEIMIAIGEDVLIEVGYTSAYTYECSNKHTVWTMDRYNKSFEWLDNLDFKDIEDTAEIIKKIKAKW